MLLERLDGGRDLRAVPIDKACTVIGTVLQQLDHEALPQLARLSQQAAGMAKKLRSAPALWNRWAEAVASADLRTHLRHRLSIICASGGLDEERVRVWAIVREVQMCLWAIKGDDTQELTKAIAIIKAMQPG